MSPNDKRRSIKMRKIFDIRTSENALQTLCHITGVSANIWERFVGTENDYQYIDDLVEYVVNRYGELPKDYREWQFVYIHITTSANCCACFKKHGILDLQESYLCEESELRTFLEENNIHIDLDKQILIHNGQVYDITYGRCPRQGTLEYKGWSVGRKFYYDFTTCGFLSLWERSPYAGMVHRRPEILMDIDNLLNTNLSQNWASSHKPYEIIAQVSGEKIVFEGFDESSEKEKVLRYLSTAYTTAFGEPSEEILLLKNYIQVPPSDIIDIIPLKCW